LKFREAEMEKHDLSRRNFVKTVAYAAPAILTLKATSALAKAGSGNSYVKKEKKRKPPKPPKKPKKRR
jgi:hypothetical protein